MFISHTSQVMNRITRLVWFVVLSLVLVSTVSAQSSSLQADDIDGAVAALESAKADLIASGDRSLAQVYRLMDLGLWEEAEALVKAEAVTSDEWQVAEAWLHIKYHRYGNAQALVDQLIQQEPVHAGVYLLHIYMLIQAWELNEAASVAQSVLDVAFDVEVAVAMGRIRLLERQYEEAMEWALRAQEVQPDHSEAHLLEADVYFWQRDLPSAEEALQRALQHNPFNADARFAYGYAIWRRVDATLLDDMAGHWNLGLALDPLNYRLNWHFGNGHTNLTYADYVHPADSSVRAQLQAVDSLIARDEVEKAIRQTRAIEQAHPESVLPAMARASAFFMAYDMDRESRLDSAQHHFLEVLNRKQNYGPAHNGVAAVIKHRQFGQLSRFDELDQEIENVSLTKVSDFTTVFPDAAYYPGDRMEKMLQVQLHKGIVYLPFLIRLQRTFTIPPLHVDLAQAMDAPYFRYATTFDNRQWMDIRGVGSGAAGIEYVERGAYLERNVVLHEYVHLFHGTILTDEEQRRIRALYLEAMQEDRILDYYSANNESEYLAQTYTAYFAPVKVHPLNHKAMNTRQDLETKDPALFDFIDELVARQSAYLEGDTLVLASNWAQVYVTLSEQARRGRGPDAVEDSLETYRVASALLDTSLTWDTTYLPAYVSYASLLKDQKEYEDAESWLDRAESLAPAYAPIYRGRAELAQARFASGVLAEAQAFDQQKQWFEKALSVEQDFAERASLNRALRELYLRFGEIPDAIRVADEYVDSAPVVSTYLRDRRDEAWVFASTQRSKTGYSAEVVDEFTELVRLKPQQYAFKLHYSDVLASAGQPIQAIQVLEDAQRILAAAGRPRKDYTVRLADLYLQTGDSTRALRLAESVMANQLTPVLDELRLVRVLVELGQTEPALARFEKLLPPSTPYEKAEYSFVEGVLKKKTGEDAGAVQAFEETLKKNPYHQQALLQLIDAYFNDGQQERAYELLNTERMGPAFVAKGTELMAPTE